MLERSEILRSLGVEEEDIQNGNVGFSIEDMDSYFLREHMENRLESGLLVPEEFIPVPRAREENNLYRRMKDMERLECERTNEDKSPMWMWSDKDQNVWEESLKSYLGDSDYEYDSDRVVGAI